MPAAGGATHAGPGARPPRSAEYDAFGPWIDPVRGPEDVPRLYRGHQRVLDGARLVLKVPRDIPRRDATPDMDLYDHLLVLHDDALTVLSRRGASVEERRTAVGDLVAVVDGVDLLDGSLTVRSRDGGTLTVRYSGSSAPVVGDLVDRLRAAVHGRPAGAPAGPSQPAGSSGRAGAPPLDRHALGDAEVGLMTAYREVADREPALATLAAHPRRVLRPSGGVRRATHVVRPMTVHAAVVCSDGADLQVFGRRSWLARGRTPVHSTSRLVVPLDRVDGTAAVPDRRYPGLTRVRLTLGAATLELPVPEASDAERVLLGLVR